MKTRKFSKIAFMALTLLVIVSAPCFSSTETGYMVASNKRHRKINLSGNGNQCF